MKNVNKAAALTLDITINHGVRKQQVQKKEVISSNQLAFDRFSKLCSAQYYLRIYPYMHQQTGECYFWIFGVKKNSQTFDFKLKVNNEILNAVMGYLTTGTLIDISNVQPDNLKVFNESVSNFSLALYQAEVSQGQRKVRHVSNKSYSKYDFGMIIYNTKDNEEMKEYINSTIL